LIDVIKVKTWYENLDRNSLDEIENYYDKEIFFKDPFNEINNRDNLKKIFHHMFENLENPHFVFIDSIDKKDQAFLTWDFHLKYNCKDYKIHGSSHLKFSKKQKIFYHRDYWDVGEEVLTKIPVLKNIYAFLRKKLALPEDYKC
tara:strand:- start:239 stop:670 length:432 start_codon:yes stop_codon:yes gene_type:complete